MRRFEKRGSGKQDRREFLKNNLAIGAAAWGSLLFGGIDSLFAQEVSNFLPDLVALKNGEPDILFDKGIAAMGGMATFVKWGQTVVVKPNIGWNREPETGANTNPLLVKRVIEHSFDAGAKKVYVFDHSVSDREARKMDGGLTCMSLRF